MSSVYKILFVFALVLLTARVAVAQVGELVAKTPKPIVGETALPDARQQADSVKTARKLEAKAAKLEAKAGKRQEKLSQSRPTEDDIVYIFGVGQNFNDTTVFLTEIIPVKFMKLDKKTKFLPFRSAFSLQLRQYLEGTLGHRSEVTCVFFDESRKKISKRFYKLKKRFLDEGCSSLVVIKGSDFTFERPSIDNVAI